MSFILCKFLFCLALLKPPLHCCIICDMGKLLGSVVTDSGTKPLSCDNANLCTTYPSFSKMSLRQIICFKPIGSCMPLDEDITKTLFGT